MSEPLCGTESSIPPPGCQDQNPSGGEVQLLLPIENARIARKVASQFRALIPWGKFPRISLATRPPARVAKNG